jgi:hypothetical protein
MNFGSQFLMTKKKLALFFMEARSERIYDGTKVSIIIQKFICSMFQIVKKFMIHFLLL